MTTKAQQKAVQKYKKNNYDRFELLTPKGNKDKIKAHAAEMGESLNGFVNRAISETMERDEERRCSPYAIIK
jgi:predicted HicB family RNase H-like nuclease